ncbi:MAG: hypothetical protein DI622_07925 [Chryseobacterium sp.]|uniref:HNH endonuclease n=1 Tax=Chryseobacterium sp. TaxID=1871047 RepID=UPI000DAFD74C|nr:HNH endonuclease [Chryseobacterium sp.]MPS65049.1 hypothetical protein [Chryseobacterium sp.]PZU20470.1 MAG: hypothetical protein DI622_07925 [Chryseobacterium sp.]
MKIPNELVPLAYQISKEVYEKKISLKIGKERLVGDKRMNENSAADYINNFKYLLEGARFTRTLNTFSMNFYFEKIHQDYGTKGLLNALSALKLHIEYYEKIQMEKRHRKHNMKNMRNIYDKYYLKTILISPDEAEQNEIISELKKINISKIKILDDLLNLKDFDDSEVIINGKKFKRDNTTIAKIKLLRNFECQICSKTIIRKNGEKYIEAAHIEPKHKKGKETLDNIILLCPNHHKEFDLGNTIIHEHTTNYVNFSINNNEKYLIKFIPEI